MRLVYCKQALIPTINVNGRFRLNNKISDIRYMYFLNKCLFVRVDYAHFMYEILL